MASFARSGNRAIPRAKKGLLHLHSQEGVQFAIVQMPRNEGGQSDTVEEDHGITKFCNLLLEACVQLQHHVADAAGHTEIPIKGFRDVIRIIRKGLDRRSVRYLEDLDTCASFIKYSNTAELNRAIHQVMSLGVAAIVQGNTHHRGDGMLHFAGTESVSLAHGFQHNGDDRSVMAGGLSTGLAGAVVVSVETEMCDNRLPMGSDTLQHLEVVSLPKVPMHIDWIEKGRGTLHQALEPQTAGRKSLAVGVVGPSASDSGVGERVPAPGSSHRNSSRHETENQSAVK